MRKIIVTEFVTVDNVMEAPGGAHDFRYAGWTIPYSSPEVMKFKFDELMASDAMLLGRITYEGFAAAWPTMTGTGEFGEKMNSMAKYVVSTTAGKLEWNNSTVVKGDLAQEIAKLKQAEGKDILVCGSGQLADSLSRLGLVDEYALLVYPVVLGEGKRLFKDGNKIDLKLIEEKKFDSGVVLLRYSVGK